MVLEQKIGHANYRFWRLYTIFRLVGCGVLLTAIVLGIAAALARAHDLLIGAIWAISITGVVTSIGWFVMGLVLTRRVLRYYGFGWSAARGMPLDRPSKFDDWADANRNH